MTLAPIHTPGPTDTGDEATPATGNPAPEAPRAGVSSRVGAATTRRHWAPKPSGGNDPAGHLTPAQIDELARELDAIREKVLASRGAADAAYIRRLVDGQRRLEAGSRIVLLFSGHPVAWVIGTAGLSIAKILENMEIGHNIMHGQWDWMRDPAIHSSTWEWDNVAPASLWKHSHNELHHTYTNVIGMDNDLGYGILRVDPDQRWHPIYVFQPVWNVLNAVFFQYSIALYDLDLYRHLSGRADEADRERLRTEAPRVARKVGRHLLRDYVIHPAVSGPNWATTITANLTANLARNLWSNAVIICGHFPSGVETFDRKGIAGESRGEWYLRQMLGSANITGGPLMHLMSGNLSHQIEHHMYPDLPSNRYAEIAPQVREVFSRYGLHYEAGSLPRQLASVWRKVFVHALPESAWSKMRGAFGRARR
ncbi:fatty acid desaturase family protein [Austwickia chelonae]|uniref:fatty acid desaturase family protein n=1 Tax=Austwickia chelonae TaxID=100225 RepID=UPI000E289DBD|nr:acyl-CoA desaturase [Austwickia chelonae]